MTEIDTKKLVGCEVGVWKGATSEQLLRHLPKLFLFMVDSWKHIGSQMKTESQNDVDDALQAAYERTDFASDRRSIIQSPSVKAARMLFYNEELDFVFIDADHLYKSVYEDIRAWWPKVRKGGLLMGHDYNCRMDRRGKWGIKRAVDEFAKELDLEIKTFPGMVWSISK